MFELIPFLLERLGIMIILAFILAQWGPTRRLLKQPEAGWQFGLLILFFATYGILSNYTGVKVDLAKFLPHTWLEQVDGTSAIANTRTMIVVISGLLAGPLGGTITGLLVGIHRYTLGGFTAFACALSTVIAGGVSGLLRPYWRDRLGSQALLPICLTGFLMVFEMSLILLLSDPFPAALELVQFIFLPMTVVNVLGVWLFLSIIRLAAREEEHVRAREAERSLHIADLTLPYLTRGLNIQTAEAVADILLQQTRADAVSLTDQAVILAHIGVGSDHHRSGGHWTTRPTEHVLTDGQLRLVTDRDEIGCPKTDCPLQAGIIAPLTIGETTIGTLKVYYPHPELLDAVEVELIEGLAKLFSTQLALGKAERQAGLLKDAEIRALEAQIHPHFLFNAINTIYASCRTDVEQARTLLLELSTFFRSNLQGARSTKIPLQKELEHIEAYISLEAARFPSRPFVDIDLEEGTEHLLVPPFILQPLIENAFQHAFSPGQTGYVGVTAWLTADQLVLEVVDNGRGIEAERLTRLGREVIESSGTGTALFNTAERIKSLYAENGSFRLTSQPGEGTTITIHLPIETGKEAPHAHNLN
ncbi:LytS/YhcK type 5TM receptor domain-containing protein [Exiguobacterium sp. RIT594]|uniref:LytS/YhcK type 5TM receptor domain-containing protein n=1 Tax=Exiguobacterium sp. RIT594 TaxID=2282449 RepID=UPI000DF7C3F3|nr:LytS/YhcK type 5TM receptor domain-containing protein [Exiguobacterium sp. RIT594]RDB32366.1 sensor histidine kinase [Exiguobacterium sp. RIT594]